MRTILEGSVRKTDNRIRVSAQLINAENGFHIWSQNYDRELYDIFAIQDDIATAVVDRLTATLLGQGDSRPDASGTSNLQAYTAYLLGKQQIDQRSSAALQKARDYFAQAVEHDPSYAEAYVGVAGAHMQLMLYGDLTPAEMFAAAQPALDKALALNDELAEAHAALGSLKQLGGDLPGAGAAYRRALELNRNSALTLYLYGNLVAFRESRLDEGTALLQRALELDPLSLPINQNVALALEASGQFDQALQRLTTTLAIEPQNALTHALIGQIQILGFGKLDEAMDWIGKSVELDETSPLYPGLMGEAYLLLGDGTQATPWVERALQRGAANSSANEAAALLALFHNDPAGAWDYAQRALAVDPRAHRSLLITRNLDVAAGRYGDAVARYEAAFPNLQSATPVVNRANLRAAVHLAYLLLETGDAERAGRLLAGAEGVLPTMPRKGVLGFGPSDAKVHALRGETAQAIDALRAAFNEGWRGGHEAWWMLKREPSLSALHAAPDFKVLMEEVEAELATIRQRVL